MLAVNVNDMVAFRLTPEGVLRVVRFFKQQAEECHCREYEWFNYHKPDADGLYVEQLWHVMEIFGPPMFTGSKPYFEGNKLYIIDQSRFEPASLPVSPERTRSIEL